MQTPAGNGTRQAHEQDQAVCSFERDLMDAPVFGLSNVSAPDTQADTSLVAYGEKPMKLMRVQGVQEVWKAAEVTAATASLAFC